MHWIKILMSIFVPIFYWSVHLHYSYNFSVFDFCIIHVAYSWSEISYHCPGDLLLIEFEHRWRCQLNLDLVRGLPAILLSVWEKERKMQGVWDFSNSCSFVIIRNFLMNHILQLNVFHQTVKYCNCPLQKRAHFEIYIHVQYIE